MSYKYQGFIPQNIAPKNAKKIVVCDANNNEVCSIGLGRMAHVTDTKLYSVGIVSDVHCYSSSVAWTPDEKLDKALTYFEDEGCVFCANSGDMTQTGFYNEGNTTTVVTGQFASYKSVCDAHDIPVYELCGNHESYVVAITNNLSELQTYCEASLYYKVEQDNDIYIFLSQPSGNVPMTDEALQWLYETLETNRNKRCFIFVHPYLDSGNVNNIYGNDVFGWWGNKTIAFKNLLKHYKNTILFHGHSHFIFECQELDETVNYNESTGFRSVHIPSLSRPAFVTDGVRDGDDSMSYGYLMDVYDDCIVLNGWDFINNEYVPLGVFKIDTTLQTIDADTFTDSTGIITLQGG
jgi:predicted phosphodiesterase